MIACAPGEHIDTGSDVVRDIYRFRLHVPHDHDEHDLRYPVMFLASPVGNAEIGGAGRPSGRGPLAGGDAGGSAELLALGIGDSPKTLF